MTDERTPEATENLGRLADDPQGDAARLGVGAADAARIARAVEALEEAVALDPEQIVRVLEDVEHTGGEIPPPVLPADYEVLGEIGRGGMGVVYRARQVSLDRIVAVKVLRPGELLFGQALKRFEREARALARLRHRHIVSIHDVGESHGRVWFSMDMIEGRSMADLLKDGRMSPSKAVRLMKQVASAVAYVHANGLVHRDLKPANILVDAEGEAVVTDFGLALEIGGGDDLTLTGQVLGTPAYMSPEQARGDAARIGETSDVYAMGAILYECLTGRRPFAHASPAMQVWAVLKEEPVPPRRIERRVPEALERVCVKAMQKRPSARYPTARAFLEDLERFEEGREVRATPPNRAWRLGRSVHRHRAPLAWALGALALAIAVFVLVIVPQLRRDPSSLVAAGDALMGAEEPAAALRVYERALAQEGREHPDPWLFSRVTDAALAAAVQHWHRSEPSAARRLLERVHQEGVQAFGRRGWGRVEEIECALATSMALDGETETADVLFDSALEDWNNRIYRETRVAFGEGRAERLVVDRTVPWLAEANDGLRSAALVQLRAVVRHGWQGDEAVIGALGGAPGDAAPLVPTIVEAVVTDKPTPVMEWHGTQQLMFAVRRTASRAVEQALADLAGDTGADRWARHAAAALLADIADLPVFSGFLQPGTLADLELEAGAAVDAWQRVRGMERKGRTIDAWRERMRLAVATWSRLEAEVAVRAAVVQASADEARARAYAYEAVQAIRRWFCGHAGMKTVRDAAEATEWIRVHGKEEPRALLTTALGLEGMPDTDDASALLERVGKARESASERAWIHHLLAFVLDAERRAPVWGLRWPGHGALARWRSLVHPRAESGWWHTARFVFADGAWARDRSADDARWLSVGSPVTLEVVKPLCRGRSVVVSVSPPGFEPTTLHTPEARMRLTAELVWTDDGLRIFIPHVAKERRGPGWFASSTLSGNKAAARFAMSPDVPLGGWSNPNAFRNEITLAVLLPERGPDQRLTTAEWYDQLGADLGRLAGEAEAALAATRKASPRAMVSPAWLGAEQRTITNLAAVACRLPLPEAVGALTRLQHVIDVAWGRHGMLGDLLVFARLNAGDEGLLDEEGLCARLDRLRSEAQATLRAGRELFWIRLLAMTTSDRIRALALERLETEVMSEEAAGDLLDLVRESVVEVTPAIRVRLDRGPTEDRSFAGLLRKAGAWTWAAGVVWVFAGLLLTLVLWPGRRPWARLVPAAWLLAVALAFVALDVRVAGIDVAPDALGYLLALVAVRVLGREARPLRTALTSWLAIAALTVVLVDASEWIVRISAFLVVAFLPELAFRLRAPNQSGTKWPHMPWPFFLLYVLPIGGAWVLAGLGQVFGWSFEIQLGGGVATFWLLAASGCVLWALFAVIYGASVRAAWRRAHASRPT